jgi:chromosome segregation ATPase
VKPNRVLPIVNLIGCILVTGVIIAQWLKERGLGTRIENLTEQVAEARDQVETERERASALERDVAQLKEAVESTVQARREAEETFTRTLGERDAQAAELATAAQQQVQLWEKAIAERDERIRALNSDLAATRKRLDEAVAKLKAAAAAR